MKVYYGSDLHLEMERKHSKSVLNVPSGDVLVLAGDIFLPWDPSFVLQAGGHYDLVMEFFERCSKNFDHVMVVAGNHEHYGGYFLRTIDEVKRHLSHFANVHVLEKSAFQVNNVVFWGATMWTDVKQSDPNVVWDVRRGMSDYVETLYSDKQDSVGRWIPLLPEDTVNDNKYARTSLKEFLTVASCRGVMPFVVTHHAPTWESVPQHHRLDNLSYAYANLDLEYVLGDMPESFWIHGHMHSRNDYMVNKCRVLSNPRGYYLYEQFARDFKFNLLEI